QCRGRHHGSYRTTALIPAVNSAVRRRENAAGDHWIRTRLTVIRVPDGADIHRTQHTADQDGGVADVQVGVGRVHVSKYHRLVEADVRPRSDSPVGANRVLILTISEILEELHVGTFMEARERRAFIQYTCVSESEAKPRLRKDGQEE